jgi:hypothetical protein
MMFQPAAALGGAATHLPTVTTSSTAPATSVAAQHPAAVPTIPQQLDVMAMFTALTAKIDALLQENVVLKAAVDVNQLRLRQFEQLISISSRSTSPRTAPSQAPSPQHAPPPAPPPQRAPSPPAPPQAPPHPLPAGGGGGSA